MSSLTEAIERIKPYLAEALRRENPLDRDFNYRSEEDYNYFSGGPKKGPVARLRLDWELATPLPSGLELPPEDIAHLMAEFMKNDLYDLILYGDTSKTDDPLLNVLDGTRKRGGIRPAHVDIFSANLFWEPKPKKKTTEYTLYILMYVEWPDVHTEL